MRVSRETAEKNRRTVVETASRLFRDNGYDGIGVAALMKAAGMTHGGFYKQFADKEALAAEATEVALADNRAKWEEIIAASDRAPVDALADWYLSPGHIEARAEGCCFAALAAEAPRHGEGVQSAFKDALDASVDMLAVGQTGRDEVLRRIATMVGALVLARAVDDADLAEALLGAAKPGA